jgi:hypothetical protein
MVLTAGLATGQHQTLEIRVVKWATHLTQFHWALVEQQIQSQRAKLIHVHC